MTSSHGISAPNGSLIKVDPERVAENGSLVIAKLEDSQEATFKKLVLDAGRKYLMPLNSAYPPMQVNGNCTYLIFSSAFGFIPQKPALSHFFNCHFIAVYCAEPLFIPLFFTYLQIS